MRETRFVAILKHIFIEDRAAKCFNDPNAWYATVSGIGVRLVTIVALNNIAAFIDIFQSGSTIYTKLLPTVFAQLSLKLIDAMGATQSQIENAQALSENAQALSENAQRQEQIIQLLTKLVSNKSMPADAKSTLVDTIDRINRGEWPILKSPRKHVCHPIDTNYGSMWDEARRLAPPASPRDNLLL
jgi:hypothetical protein